MKQDANAMPATARLANTSARAIDAGAAGARRAAPGGMPFDPPHCQDRTKRDTPCQAPRAKETLYCAGHLRKRGDL